MSKFTHHRLFRILLVIALFAIIGVSALTGTVAAAENFEIDTISVPDTVSAGDDLDVKVTINNTNNTDGGTQNITFADNQQTAKQKVSLGPGAKTNTPITLEWKDVKPNQESIWPTVETENESKQPLGTIKVLYSEYVVDEFEANRTNLPSGEDIDFTATIRNDGTYNYKEEIYLNVSNDSGIVSSTSRTIDPKGSTQINYPPKTAKSPGEYTYTIKALNNETKISSKSKDVTVSGDFTVGAVDGSMDGQNLTVVAELGKRGLHKDTQRVNFSIGTRQGQFNPPASNEGFVRSEQKQVQGTDETVEFEVDIGKTSFDNDVIISTNLSGPDGTAKTYLNINDRINLGPGNFKITKFDPRNSAKADGNFTVKPTIENDGTFNATQTVELVNSETDEVIHEKDVLIKKGQSKRVELYWDPTPPLSEREILPEVRTENDTNVSSKYVTLQPQFFEIRELTVNKQSVSTGEGLIFNATVRNVGTKQATRSIELVGSDGTQLATNSITIGAKDQKIVQFTTTASATPGEKQYTARNGDSEATETVTVGDFNVEIDGVSFEGSMIRVDGTVSKLGAYTTTQPIELTVNGNTVKTKQKTVKGTSPAKVQFNIANSGTFPKKVTLKAPKSGSAQNSDSTTIETFSTTGPKIKNVIDTVVQSGDTLEFTYTAAGSNVGSVEAELIDPNGDTVRDGIPLTPGEDKTGRITIPGRDAIIDGGYDLRITVSSNIAGITAKKSDTVTGAFVVSNAINPEAIGVLGEPVTRTPAGDFVTIPTGGQYMLIGGNTYSGNRQQYLDILHVSGGSTTLNTRYLGTDVSSEKAYGEGVTSLAHSSIGANAGPSEREGTVFEDLSFEGDASSLAEFRDTIGIDARSAPLQAGRYQLVAGEKGQVTVRNNGDVGFVKSVGRSNLVLTQTQRIGSIETYILPPGKASETEIGEIVSAPESDTVAIGDRLAIEVPATGMWGAMLPDAESEPSAERIAELLSNEPGVRIEFSPRDQFNNPNAGGGSLQFDDVSADDVAVLPDRTTDLWENETTVGDEPGIGGYYIVIDTRDSLGSDGEYMMFEMAYESPPGSSYQFESYNFDIGAQPDPFSQVTESVDGTDHYPYFGDSDTTVQENTTVLFQEPSVQYDRVMPDGEVIIPAQPDGRVFGSTTLAPESEATIQIISSDRPDPEIVTIEEITIDEDRRFDVQADFSQLEPGQPATVEFYAQNRLEGNRLIDTQKVNVVDDIENPATFEIQSLPSEVTVQQRESLGEIAASIQNTGSISGRKQIEFWINGESIKNETIILPSGVNETLSLSDQFVTLPVGTYPYTVRTEDDEATGELTVEPPESGTTITEADSSSAVSSSAVGDGNPSNDSGSGSPSSGLFGLVGVSGRDVALGAALTGTAHVLGYWA
jgi:hypothetical protein